MMKIKLDVITSEQTLSLPESPLGFRERRKIGRGSEGYVYEVLWNGMRVAVKVLRMRNCKSECGIRSNGIEGVTYLRHKNIVNVLKKIKFGDFVFIVMEKCDGDIFWHLSKSELGRYEEEEARNIFAQITHGLIACHQKLIYHGDLKPENILLAGGLAKLADFYYNIMYDDNERDDSVHPQDSGSNVSTPTRVGTIEYLAPELIHSHSHPSTLSPASLAAADVWALGLTLFVMAAGYKPWESALDQDPHYSRFLEDPEEVWPVWFSESLRNLLGGMLNHDADRRLSLLQVWEHPWLIGILSPHHIRPDLEPLHIETHFSSKEKDVLEECVASNCSDSNLMKLDFVTLTEERFNGKLNLKRKRKA